MEGTGTYICKNNSQQTVERWWKSKTNTSVPVPFCKNYTLSGQKIHNFFI